MERDPRNKPEIVHVEVDSSQMKALIESNSRLEKEKEELQKKLDNAGDAQEKLDLIAQNAFEKKKRELNAPDFINDPDSLMAFEFGKKGKQEPKIPSGVVGLETQQPYQGDFMTKSYANSADLVKDLRIQAQNGDARAKQALDALFLKAIKNGQSFRGKSEPISLKELTKKRVE